MRAQQIADGLAVFDQTQINPGDAVAVRGKWAPVQRDNPTTVTVLSHGLTNRVPYSHITDHRAATTEQEEGPETVSVRGRGELLRALNGWLR